MAFKKLIVGSEKRGCVMMVEMWPNLAQFGVAGLMGALWMGERFLSRKREAELTAAHERLMEQRRELRVLVQLVRQNSQALASFDQTQRELMKLLEKIDRDMPRRVA